MAAIILLGNVKYDSNGEGLACFSQSGESTSNIAKVKRTQTSSELNCFVNYYSYCSVHRRNLILH